MVRAMIASVMLAATLSLGGGDAFAGGWSGADSYRLRAGFSRGFTLKPLWDRLTDR